MTRDVSRWLDPTNPWLLIALAAGLVVGSAGWMGALAETETSMDLRDTADQRATAWDERAHLVGVGAGEHTGHGSHDHNHSHHWTHASDEGVGQGKPPAWTYTYEAGQQALRVTVAANGTVLNETESEARNRTAITGWNVDVRQAVETAREHDEAWDSVDARWAFYGLHQAEPDEDPLWILGVGGNASLRIAAVNATTGEYLHSWGPAGFYGWWGWGSWSGSWDNSWNGSWGDSGNASDGDWDDEPPREAGTVDGRLTATDPDENHRFALDHDDHEELNLQLELDEPRAGVVDVTVRGPDGRQVQLEAGPTDPDGEANLPHPSTGSYTVDVALEDGVAQEYTLDWCAPGESWGGMGYADEAC